MSPVRRSRSSRDGEAVTGIDALVMCECPDGLVNEWLDRAGVVVEARTLSGDTGEVDAAAFLAHPTAAAWRIVCPACRRTYVAGRP